MEIPFSGNIYCISIIEEKEFPSLDSETIGFLEKGISRNYDLIEKMFMEYGFHTLMNQKKENFA